MDSNLKNKEDLNLLSIVKKLRLKNFNKTIIREIYIYIYIYIYICICINSILSKLDQLKELVLKHVDVLVVCETKLDETFPSPQSHMDRFFWHLG